MSDTVIDLPPALQARFAVPHDDYMRPTSPWHLPALAGAGAIRSDADDLLTLLAAHMGLTPTPHAPAMAAMRVRRADGPAPRVRIGIVWNLIDAGSGSTIVFHDGGTGGFRTSMAFDLARKRGVVVLTNAAVEPSSEDIALHVLSGAPLAVEKPVPPAPRTRVAIAMAPQLTIAITRDGDHLLAKLTGQAAYPIFPEAPREFFWRVVDAQLSFVVDAANQVTGVILHQNGKDLRGTRVAR
jgi:CubicO group peptidase (beta-lactamase class C family)